MKPTPSVAVATWMRAQSPRSLFTASICQAEILAGVAVLPTGRRRAEFEAIRRTRPALRYAAASAYADIVADRP